jgi:hypothetical protein
MKKLQAKDPNEVIDYMIDWAHTEHGSPGALESLGNDTITGTPLWIVPVGITLASQLNNMTTTTGFFSGGTAGADYTITVRITTVGGRTLERSFILPVVDSVS